MTESQPTTRTILRRFCLIGIAGFVLMVVAFFVIENAKSEAAKMSTSNKFKQIELAAHNYSDSQGHLPAPYFDPTEFDKSSTLNPDESKRLSWRVALLPFIMKDPLYYQIKKTEDWDSPSNAQYSRVTFSPYVAPLDLPHPDSRYRVFYDNGALFDIDPKKRVGFDKITDGAANTILVVESREAVPWTQFNEHKYDPNGPLPELGHPSRKKSGFFVAMADGSVKFLKHSIDRAMLRAMITKDGGEEVKFDK